VAKDEPLKTDRQPSDRPPNRSARAEARCLRAGRLPPRRQRAGAVELPDEGAWDFRTTDRLTTPKMAKSYHSKNTLTPSNHYTYGLDRHRSHNLTGTIVPLWGRTHPIRHGDGLRMLCDGHGCWRRDRTHALKMTRRRRLVFLAERFETPYHPQPSQICPKLSNPTPS